MFAHPLTETFTAAPQIRPDDVADIARLGFTTLINARPDGEEPDQPGSARMKAAAEAAGLVYAHIPVAGSDVSDADVEAMRTALERRDGKVFGFCRSGMRAAVLWALASADREAPESLIAAAGAAGYDISGLAPAMEARHAAARQALQP